jgi:hypothetical protein
MASEDRLNAIIDAIATRLSAVTGIGRVHKYMRWSTEQAFDSIALATSTTPPIVNFWQVTRLSTQERWLTTREVWRAHTFGVYGAYGLLDANATETTFQNLLERVAHKFRSHAAWTLDGTIESLAPYIGDMASASPLQGAIGGLQILQVAHVEKQNRLMHWADCRLGVQESPQVLD